MQTQKCENFSKSSKLTKLNSVRTPSFRMPRRKKRPGFVNISPTWVIDTSSERSSRVLQHGNQKIWFSFSKKFEIEFDLYFDLCWRAEIIQVGLNMHLYDDIGDASSSLRGSTSSLLFRLCLAFSLFLLFFFFWGTLFLRKLYSKTLNI